MEIKILFLLDDYGFFTRSLLTRNKTNTVDEERIIQNLKKLFGSECTIRKCKFGDLNFNKKDVYDGWYVLYASSDDYGLIYKDYIEDILLRLIADGAILIPNFNFFRSHHNKSFMELYKTIFLPEKLNTIYTQVFSEYDILKRKINNKSIGFPVVIKASTGAGSSGVRLARNKKELLKNANKFSRRKYSDFYANRFRSPFMQRLKNRYRRLKGQPEVFYKPMQGKFIIQNFVSGLTHDYKILVFGKKYYVLKRVNRDNDFRASGSGKLGYEYNFNEVTKVLDYANIVYGLLNVPMASLDIANDGEKNHLIEYQCINFGPYTLQYAPFYFVRDKNGKWEKVKKTSVLEDEYALSIKYYFDNYICVNQRNEN